MTSPTTSTEASPAQTLPPDALPQGFVLNGGAYVVDSMLGRGGFGLTYLCAEPALLRWVAVKELFPPGAIREGTSVTVPRGTSIEEWDKMRRAFASEARKLAGFADSSIVRVFGVWEENGTAYLAMEALDGGSLAANLKAKGTLTPKRTCELGIDLCRALGLLHEGNLLHRDVKPDNIFFAADGSPVLIDFGNARRLVAHQTQTTSLALTPGYAPPEAYSSRGANSAASDLYSLGATLWHCLSGSPPPDATDRVLGAPLPDSLDRLPMCPPLMAQTLVKALSLRPEDRFQSAREMMDALSKSLGAVEAMESAPLWTPAPAPTQAQPLPWHSDQGICPNCGKRMNITAKICPHCGRYKSGYVPGEYSERQETLNATWKLWTRFFVGALLAVLVIGGMARAGRSIRRVSGGRARANAYADTPTKLRLQSTDLRRALEGTQYVASIRPRFHNGSIDIVITPAWQSLSRDDRLDMAGRWADQWRNQRAPLSGSFQITDKKGNVLGGRDTGAEKPWLK